MSDRVSVTINRGVADVRLNRPDKLNSLDMAMIEAIIETGRGLAADKSVRAVVLSGEGRAFCAGLDFASFMDMAGGPDKIKEHPLFSRGPESPANKAQLAGYVWTELPMPVIAAVHGYAFGGGLQIALGADMRVVHPEARFSVMEIKWGLIPDMSGTRTLRHLVRLDVAKELTFTGRQVTGEEALQLGLATRLSEEPMETAMEMAWQIAGKSPHAIRAAKELFNRSVLIDDVDGLLLEQELQMSVIGGPNQIEAVMANMQKREPNFSDPE